MSLRVILIHEERLFLDFIRDGLEARGVTVLLAAHKFTLPEESLEPDFAIVDKSALVRSAYVLVDQIKKIYPSIRIIELGKGAKQAALEQKGIASFIRTDAPADDCVKLLNLLKKTGLISHFDHMAHHGEETFSKIVESLPTQQRITMDLLMQGFAPKDIKAEMGVESSTVTENIGRLCDKFGLNERKREKLVAELFKRKFEG